MQDRKPFSDALLNTDHLRRSEVAMEIAAKSPTPHKVARAGQTSVKLKSSSQITSCCSPNGRASPLSICHVCHVFP